MTAFSVWKFAFASVSGNNLLFDNMRFITLSRYFSIPYQHVLYQVDLLIYYRGTIIYGE